MREKIRTAMLATRMAATLTKLAALASLATSPAVNVAYAKVDLPRPYVSRALDAVLIPINHESRHRYQIPPKLRGVYVLAVSPHGVAARQGIRPGDVLSSVRAQPILMPADVDRLVWAAFAVSVSSFLFGVARGPDIVQINTNITVSNFNDNVTINNINSWTSVENNTEWTEIVSEYHSDISESLTEDTYRSDSSVSDTTSTDTRSDSSVDDGNDDSDAPDAAADDDATPDDSTDEAPDADDGGDGKGDGASDDDDRNAAQDGDNLNDRQDDVTDSGSDNTDDDGPADGGASDNGANIDGDDGRDDSGDESNE